MNINNDNYTSSANQPAFLLYWLRESTPGHLEHDAGVPLGAAGLAGAMFGSRCAAERIVQAASGVEGEVEVEVHLPYFDRRCWPKAPAMLEETRFASRGRQVLPVDYLEQPELMNQYVARSLAATAFHPAPQAGLRYEYGGEVTSVSPQACRAWREAPAETSGAYFPIHARVSVAIQQALRKWLPVEWFGSLSRYEDTAEAYAVLAYAASTPCQGRRPEFTYETMCADWARPLFVHARAPLRQRLKAVRAELLAAGRKELAESYYPYHVKDVLEKVRRQRRNILNLMVAEGNIVNRVLRFGVELRAERNARGAAHVGAECARSLNKLLRRYYRDHDWTRIAPVLLFEATAALWGGLAGRGVPRNLIHSPHDV